MAAREFLHDLLQTLSILPLLRTASVNGEEADLQGYDSALALIEAGTCTDGTFTISLEESDVSGSGFTTVAAGDIVGTLPAITTSNDDQSYTVAYVGNKQFLRVVATASGSPSTGMTFGATILAGNARTKPVN